MSVRVAGGLAAALALSALSACSVFGAVGAVDLPSSCTDCPAPPCFWCNLRNSRMCSFSRKLAAPARPWPSSSGALASLALPRQKVRLLVVFFVVLSFWDSVLAVLLPLLPLLPGRGECGARGERWDRSSPSRKSLLELARDAERLAQLALEIDRKC